MGFGEQTARMKELLEHADELQMLGKSDTVKVVLMQALSGYEALAKKKRQEIAHIQAQIAACDGAVQACEIQAQLLADILDNMIKQERQARDEIAARAAERLMDTSTESKQLGIPDVSEKVPTTSTSPIVHRSRRKAERG